MAAKSEHLDSAGDWETLTSLPRDFLKNNLMENTDAWFQSLTTAVGENPEREGLKETPRRIYKSLLELLDGYGKDPGKVLEKDFAESSSMVTASDIEFYSLCEHHMLPFFGHVHIAYIPNGKVVGISKLARLVEIYSHRLQVQERLTEQIADALAKHVSPDVAVKITGKHLCMSMRGVRNGAKISSLALRGRFRKPAVKKEFLDSLQAQTH